MNNSKKHKKVINSEYFPEIYKDSYEEKRERLINELETETEVKIKKSNSILINLNIEELNKLIFN